MEQASRWTRGDLFPADSWRKSTMEENINKNNNHKAQSPADLFAPESDFFSESQLKPEHEKGKT